MPQRLTRHRGLQHSLQPAGPIPGLRRAGGMCQGKRSIYNINIQDLSRSINNYPGIRARFILVNQELSWNSQQVLSWNIMNYPGIRARFILANQELSWSLQQVLSWNIMNYPGIRARFILVMQELSWSSQHVLSWNI